MLGGVGLVVVRFDARFLYDGLLSGWAAACLVVAILGIVATVALTRRGHSGSARVAAVLGIGSMVLAGGLAQRPYVLPRTLTVEAAAADSDTLHWLMVVTAVALALVVPALALLYRLDATDRLVADHDEDLAGAQVRVP